MVSQPNYHQSSEGRRFSSSFSPYVHNPSRYSGDARSIYVPGTGRGITSHDTHVGSSLGSQKGEPTRKRIAVACGRCRHRKIKCSGDKGHNIPCSNCQSAGVSECLFLRVSSREASMKPEFNYNTDISRAFANRQSVPPSSHGHGPYGQAGYVDYAADYRTNSLYSRPYYSYSHTTTSTAGASNLGPPPSPWAPPSYADTCTQSPVPQSPMGHPPVDYVTPGPTSGNTPAAESTSHLVAPFTWDGRTSAAPIPPPLPLKMQTPTSSAYSPSYGPSSSYSPYVSQVSHTAANTSGGTASHHGTPTHHQHNPLNAHNDHINCNADCRDHTRMAPLGTKYNSHGYRGPGDLPCKLVYRPAVRDTDSTGLGSYADDVSATDNQTVMHTVMGRASAENLGRLAISTVSEPETVGISAPMSRAPSQNGVSALPSSSVAATSTPLPSSDANVMSLSRFHQDTLINRSNANSPAPLQPIQAQAVDMPPPLMHSVNTHTIGNVVNSPYASAHGSAANSSDHLAHIAYNISPRPPSQQSHHAVHAYTTTSTDGCGLFSDQERNAVGTQGGAGSNALSLDSYTYGSFSTSISSSATETAPSPTKEPYKRSSMDDTKSRPYSPVDGPMLSGHHASAAHHQGVTQMQRSMPMLSHEPHGKTDTLPDM